MTPCTLAQQELRGGDVTRWDLDDATLARWSSAPIDARPASHDQHGRLHEDPDGTSPWSAWIGFTVLLLEATHASVERTLTEWFGQHESLRSHLVLADDGLERRTLAPEQVGFSPVPLGEHDEDSLRALLVEEFHTRCRPSARPACSLVTVEVEQGHVLHAAFDHITFDGLSAYTAVGHIASLHAAVLGDVHQPRTSPSHVDVAATEIEVGETITSEDPRLGPWRDVLDGGRIPPAPTESGIAPDGRYEHDLVRHDICTGQTAADLALRYAAEGVPTGMLWTAILMRALGGRTPVLVSTHGRPSSLWRDSVGWFAGVAPLAPSVPEGTGTRGWALETVRAWREAAPAAALPLGLVGRLLGVPVEPSIVLSTIDGSRIDGHEWWGPLQSAITLGDVPPSSQMHVWLTVVPDGVTLATRLPLAPGARDWLDAVAERFARLVEHEASSPAPPLEVPA